MLGDLFEKYQQFQVPYQPIWVQLKAALAVVTSAIQTRATASSYILPNQLIDLSADNQYGRPWMSMAFAVEEEVCIS
jgi:hypothetical protein